jgi:hypothetical protein
MLVLDVRASEHVKWDTDSHTNANDRQEGLKNVGIVAKKKEKVCTQ